MQCMRVHECLYVYACARCLSINPYEKLKSTLPSGFRENAITPLSVCLSGCSTQVLHSIHKPQVLLSNV